MRRFSHLKPLAGRMKYASVWCAIDFFRMLLAVAPLFFPFGAVAHSAELTKADIPADVAPNVRLLIERTFSDHVRERSIAARKLGEMREQSAPAVPFLMRLLDE